MTMTKDLLPTMTTFPSGIDSENRHSRTVKFSPQLVSIEPGQTEKVEIYRVPQSMVLRLADFTIEHFSGQAVQDVQSELLLDALVIWRSGLYRNNYQRNARPASDGAPYAAISRTDLTGYHDNYAGKQERIFKLARGNQLVIFQLKNQSEVYTHHLLVTFSGWQFPANLLEQKRADTSDYPGFD